MLFKVDENLLLEVSDLLRDHGHDVATVLEQQLGGKTDAVIADICQTEGRALITLDLDFSDIRQYPPEDSQGIIVLRPNRQTKSNLIHLTERAIALLSTESLDQSLWIVDDYKVRIRRADQSGPP